MLLYVPRVTIMASVFKCDSSLFLAISFQPSALIRDDMYSRLSPGACSLTGLFVQSTLGLAEVLPTARPCVFSGQHRSRAMRTADAGIVAIVQGIVRHVMEPNVGPDIVGAPLCQRIK